MAKLSDIAVSQESAKQVTGVESIAHTLGVDSPENTYESEFVIFRLSNTKKKGRVYIDGQEDMKNPISKRVERARLLAGVESIWMKDQKDLDKDYVKQNRRSLTFEGRTCRIRRDDKAAIEFARLSKHYVDDPSVNTGGMYAFFEWNPQRQAEAALAKRKGKLDAMRKAMDAPSEQMRKHALYLGVHAVDELGIPKREDAIRDEYIMKAEDNPVAFIQSFGSLVVDVTYLVTRALIDAKIDTGREQGRAYYTTGGFICSIPQGRNAKEVLVELATSKTPEGKEFLQKLEAIAN